MRRSSCPSTRSGAWRSGKGRTASFAVNIAMAGRKTRASKRENRRATFQPYGGNEVTVGFGWPENQSFEASPFRRTLNMPLSGILPERPLYGGRLPERPERSPMQAVAGDGLERPLSLIYGGCQEAVLRLKLREVATTVSAHNSQAAHRGGGAK